MVNRVIHIPAAEAASDYRALLNHVGAGDEVVIEHDTCPAAVVRSVAPRHSSTKRSRPSPQKTADEGRQCVPPDLANYLDHCLYIREAL